MTTHVSRTWVLGLALLLTADATQLVTATMDASAPGKPIARDQLAGTCLPVWNRTGVYREISRGLREAGFTLYRFPNGSLSNDYHWNGQGAYSADGIWQCDSTSYLPGFMSKTRFRGTSKSHYGFVGYSAITDGDTATFWWSDYQVRESPHSFYVELPVTQTVDSVVILWGERYGVDFSVDIWRAMTAPYPGPHAYAQDLWETLDSVRGNARLLYGARLSTDLPTKFVRVVVDSALGGEGVQVREMNLYRNDTLITRNIPSYDGTNATQTKVTALGAHAGNVRTSESYDWDFGEFMAFVGTIDAAAIPVICVNYGTGTPDEAAAWVHYANRVKGCQIRYWQVGNEMDGAWEEGGPVSAAAYAERFVAYSKAMKKVDSSIKVLGPVLSNADFHIDNSGEYDGMSWMESFIAYVGALEKTDGVTYLDGIDFHSYPYYSTAPSVTAMMQRATYVYDRCDSLTAWIGAHLLHPESTRVMLSEYNSSVVMSSLLQQHINGIFAAAMLAGMVDKFGDRAMAVFWDSYEGMSQGPNGTWGSLSLFNSLDQSRYSSFRRAPSSAYWALYTVLNVWLSRNEPATVSPVTVDPATGVRAFGLSTEFSRRLLLVNTTADTVLVNTTVTGDSREFGLADCFTWSEREFRWIGGDQNAYAAPNCGPSSRRIAAAQADSILLPPQSLAVVVFQDEAPASSPRWLHTGAESVVLRPGTLLTVFGTAVSPSGVGQFSYRLDRTGDFTPAASLDGACDGPVENLLARIDVSALTPGSHTIFLRMLDSASVGVVDSLPFKIVGDLKPGVMIDNFEDGDVWNMLPVKQRWNSYAGGRNETSVTMSIDSATGAHGKSLAGTFSIIQPAALGYDNYVSITNGMDTAYLRQNVAGFAGLTFSYATTHSSTSGGFAFHVLTTTVKDYDEYHLTLANTNGAWTTVSARWEDFRQYGWGTPAGPLDPSTIRAIEFRALRAGEGSIAIDNITFASDGPARLNPLSARPGDRASLLRITNGPGKVTFDVRLHAPSRLVIYDTSGRVVHRSPLLQPAVGRYVWTPQRRALPRGTYVVSLSGATQRITLLR